MATFAKPENALKRAEELMNVGQKAAALQSLHDLITSKRYRTWQKPLERIMLKYVELCVDMRKGRFAKDGLIQYRIACQQVNVQSLEEVVKYFLKLATEKAEQAQAQVEAAAAEAALGEVADLDAEKSPEDLMLGFVSGEKGKERTDSELVTPWFKFLWEAYRTVLDVLRNNCKMEALYAMTAHRAFGFCQQYKRTNEFRRLCEILRNHLVNLNKYRDQRDRPDLALPETLQLYLDTRFEQLKVATELGLWQEAFRSVEDIHGLMLLSKKAPKPQLMAVYYARLTRIFAMAAVETDSDGIGSSGGGSSGSARLYHAYAWYKLYLLQRSYNKNLKDKDLQLLASAVVLSALAVPPYERYAGGAGAGKGGAEGELAREKAVRMANLLGVVVDPKKDPRQMLSRSALLQEISTKGVLAFVLPQVRELHHLVEVDFLPLDLASRVHPLLQRLPELSDVKLSAASPVPKVELQAYTPALQRLATLRVLQQASQVYEVMTIPSLCRMVPFGDLVFVERVLAEAVGEGFVHVRLDFCEGTVKFGADELESDRVRSHLATMARHLDRAVALIRLKAPAPAPEAAEQLPPAEEIQAAVEKEHRRLIARKTLIERRKEEAEREVIEKEREEQTAKLKQQRLTEEAEAKRLAAESARREEERIRREIEAKELEEARQLLLESEKRKGKKGKKNLEDTMRLDKRQLMEEALSEQLKEKQEAERRLQKLVRTLDHLERARREEEKPLLEAAYQQRLVEERAWFEQQQAEAAEQSKKQHEQDLAEKIRLSRMLGDKEEFQEQVVGRRRGEFERLKREREEKVAELRELRRTERVMLRKREMFRRQEEAKALKAWEETERRKREELERKRKEEEERLKKLEEMAAKQRQREEEAEEKARKAREEVLAAATERKTSAFVPPALRARGGGSAAAGPAGEAPPSGRGGADEDRWSRDRAPAPAAAASGGASAATASAAPGKYVPPVRGGAGGAGGGAGGAGEGVRWGGDREREERGREERGREGGTAVRLEEGRQEGMSLRLEAQLLVLVKGKGQVPRQQQHQQQHQQRLMHRVVVHRRSGCRRTRGTVGEVAELRLRGGRLEVSQNQAKKRQCKCVECFWMNALDIALDCLAS
ncbi:hypothetical protein CLOP_g5423 [Closterium sp. NIES-67]|nr:hypothetical protein CLOP_g5423 [Closterium sp. NIES-67]GJP74900.1 hypothetical protein CLOP_g5423 [Closterium sp. NIES-67]